VVPPQDVAVLLEKNQVLNEQVRKLNQQLAQMGVRSQVVTYGDVFHALGRSSRGSASASRSANAPGMFPDSPKTQSSPRWGAPTSQVAAVEDSAEEAELLDLVRRYLQQFPATETKAKGNQDAQADADGVQAAGRDAGRQKTSNSAFKLSPHQLYRLTGGAEALGLEHDGTTLLHQAVANHHTSCVEMLLDAGAPCEFPNRWGDTPADYAGAFPRSDPLVKLLRSRGILVHQWPEDPNVEKVVQESVNPTQRQVQYLLFTVGLPAASLSRSYFGGVKSDNVRLFLTENKKSLLVCRARVGAKAAPMNLSQQESTRPAQHNVGILSQIDIDEIGKVYHGIQTPTLHRQCKGLSSVEYHAREHRCVSLIHMGSTLDLQFANMEFVDSANVRVFFHADFLAQAFKAFLVNEIGVPAAGLQLKNKPLSLVTSRVKVPAERARGQ